MKSAHRSTSRAATKDVPPALERVRLAELSDASRALQLCTEPMKRTFRISSAADIEYLIESSVLAITHLNIRQEVVGFLSVREYPLVPAVDPMAWEEYIWTKYKTIELKARNTFWIHLMCWNRRYAREVVDSLFKSVYIHDPYMQYICMIKTDLTCPQLVPGSSRAEAVFRRVQAMERGVPGEQLPVLLIADRKDACPRLRVRRAVEEDNDDIVPIIDRHSERLRELYGDFYVSELISRHPESDRVLLVCEHKELAVGVICLNTQINFESLEECFELSAFAGLRKLDQPPHKHRSNDADSCSYISDGNVDGTTSATNLNGGDAVISTICLSTDTFNKTKDMQSKVTWTEAEDELADGALYGAEGQLLTDASILDYLDLLTEEDEDLDFEIVNIDPELLRLPFVTSSNDPAVQNYIDNRTKTERDSIDNALDSITVPKKEKKKSSSSLSKAPEYITRYSGAPNCFLLEFCAMHHEYDERYAYDMLEAAFEMFPDRDYCIVSLPSNHSPFPLLEHFSLVTPHPTRMRFINESLYVAHVNSVKGDVAVRPGEAADLLKIVDILEHSHKRDKTIALFEQSLKSRVLSSFTLLSQKQPVGVVIVGPLESAVSIRIQYELNPEPRWALSDGAIIAASLSPMMDPHARWFLRDIMRQTRYCSLFWICQPFARGEMCPTRNLMSLTERMIPIRPRGSLPNISGVKHVDHLFRDEYLPFALWMIERPLTSLPKVNVNNAIVVVGASRTGLAFIEALILGPCAKYLSFTNLTLVSEHGLPTVSECLKAADTAVPREGRYTDHYLKSIPFCFYIDIIPAALTKINRKKKCIYLASGGLKYYDQLVLTCGQQFQHPDYLMESLEKVKEVRKGLPCKRMLMDNPMYQPDRVPPAPLVPDNLFLINSIREANIIFSKLLKMMAERREQITDANRIVVYGDCLEAYCCISALMELGVSGKHIAFIENFPLEDFTACRINCFNDEVIDERVQERMEDLGIRCYRNCRMTKLHIHHREVTALSLMDPLHAIKVKSFALFYYGLKAINIKAFKAINECGLVYDGGLVVNPTFGTNDPNIYGAGTCCNYSRCLYAANRNHKYYNSEEVGESLADLFLLRHDPFISCNPDYVATDILPRYSHTLYSRSHGSIPDVNPSRLHLTQQAAGRGWQPVIKFENPIVRSATLPGPLYYMKTRKPGPDIPMEVQLNLPHQGHTLLTDKNDNYFRLRLSALHCVDAVTCLSKDHFSSELFSQLYGKHEAYFNKLLLRYQMEQIDDLYKYFTHTWMSAFYEETFQEMMDNIREYEVLTITDKIRSKFGMAGDELEKKSMSKSSQVSGNASKISSSKISWSSKMTSTCMSLQTCTTAQDLRNMKKIEMFGDVLKNYATKTSIQMESTRGPSDIPTECGQSANLRDEVAVFWDAIGGDNIVVAKVAENLDKYSVPNPHYAPTHPDHYTITLQDTEEKD